MRRSRNLFSLAVFFLSLASWAPAAPSGRIYLVNVSNPVSGGFVRDSTHRSLGQARRRVATLSHEYWVTYRQGCTQRYEDGGCPRTAARKARALRCRGYQNVRVVKKNAQLRSFGRPRPACTHFRNATRRKLKICIYNVGDALQIVPRKVLWVKPGHTVSWRDRGMIGHRFHAKVFVPGLIDRLVASRRGLRYGDRRTLARGRGGYAIR